MRYDGGLGSLARGNSRLVDKFIIVPSFDPVLQCQIHLCICSACSASVCAETHAWGTPQVVVFVKYTRSSKVVNTGEER